jgi:hypothetical protein
VFQSEKCFLQPKKVKPMLNNERDQEQLIMKARLRFARV